MKFQGDLIITDPAFVAKDAEDWKRSAYGDHMEKLGMKTVLSLLVTEGEEDLMAKDAQTGAYYGTFVSDTGVATAFLLEEILQYDPSFDEHIACPENVVLIPGFSGEVCACGTGNDQWFTIEGSTQNGESIRLTTQSTEE